MQHASTLAAPPPIADGRLAGSSDPTLTRDEWNAHAVAYVFADEFAGRWWLEGSLRVYLYCCWQTMKPGLSEPDRKEYLWRLGYLNESPLATMAISEIDHRAIEAERVRLLQRGMTRQVVDSVLALLDEALRGVLDGRVYVDEAYLDYSRAPWLAESRASRRAALKAAPAPGVRRPGADGARRESHAARPGHRRAGSTSSTASSDPGDCDGPGEAGPRLWLAPRPCRLREAEGRRL